MEKNSKCPKCGDFTFDYYENKNINFIVCPICKEALGAIYKPDSPEGLDYYNNHFRKG